MESPQLSNKESSANISVNVESKTDAQETQLSTQAPSQVFQSEAPLLGLCPKPVHLMTDDEKRKHLAKIRNLRSNFAGWRSQVANGGEKADVTEVPVNTGLEDLL